MKYFMEIREIKVIASLGHIAEEINTQNSPNTNVDSIFSFNHHHAHF